MSVTHMEAEPSTTMATSTSPRLKLRPPYTQYGRAAATATASSTRMEKNQNLMWPRNGYEEP